MRNILILSDLYERWLGVEWVSCGNTGALMVGGFPVPHTAIVPSSAKRAPGCDPVRTQDSALCWTSFSPHSPWISTQSLRNPHDSVFILHAPLSAFHNINHQFFNRMNWNTEQLLVSSHYSRSSSGFSHSDLSSFYSKSSAHMVSHKHIRSSVTHYLKLKLTK